MERPKPVRHMLFQHWICITRYFQNCIINTIFLCALRCSSWTSLPTLVLSCYVIPGSCLCFWPYIAFRSWNFSRLQSQAYQSIHLWDGQTSSRLSLAGWYSRSVPWGIKSFVSSLHNTNHKRTTKNWNKMQNIMKMININTRNLLKCCTDTVATNTCGCSHTWNVDRPVWTVAWEVEMVTVTMTTATIIMLNYTRSILLVRSIKNWFLMTTNYDRHTHRCPHLSPSVFQVEIYSESWCSKSLHFG